MKPVTKEFALTDPVYREAFARITATLFGGSSSWLGGGMLGYGLVALLSSGRTLRWAEGGLALISGAIFLFLWSKKRSRILLERVAEGYGAGAFCVGTFALALGGFGRSGLGAEIWQALLWIGGGICFSQARLLYTLLALGGLAWSVALALAPGAGDPRYAVISATALMVGAALSVILQRGKEAALWHWVPYEIRDKDRTADLVAAKEQANHLNLRCRQFSQASFEALVIYEKSRVVEINEAVTTLFGYSAGEMVGRDFLDLVAPSRRDQVAHATQMGSFRPMETVGLKKNGQTFPVEISIKLLPSNDKPLRVAAFRDLSELKSAQELLQREKELLERQYRRQAALAELGVIIDDPKQYSELLQQLVTVACQQLPARCAAFFTVEDDGRRLELRSSNLASFPDESKLLLDEGSPYAVKGVLETSESLMVSDIGKDPFGIRMMFPGEEIESFLVVPFMVEGGMAGVLYILSSEPRRFEADDMSFLVNLNSRVANALMKVQLFEQLREANTMLEQQHAELQQKNVELMSAKDAAEASSRAKSQFLDTMSHELRTPLNGILGMISVMEFSELTDEQQDNLKTMKESADALLRQIGDVLEFTQLDGGRLELDTGTVVAPILMQAVVDGARAQATAKRLTIVSQPTPGAMKAITADGARIQEVLARLVDNAIKFTEAGVVTLRATQAMDRQGRTVMRFDVVDTGPGIPDSQRPFLFQAFRQADGAMNRKHGGSGLGLAICHRLVSLMGGDIGVQRDPGGGSMFWFSVPVGK